MPKPKHVYILDTCVLLHDPKAIYRFEEHDVYIPLAVIDDLDAQKTQPGSLGWSARTALREIDKHDGAQAMARGVEIGESGGRLFLLNDDQHKLGDKPQVVKRNSDDALILSGLSLKNAHPKRKVALVTKDTSLRLRATVHGVDAENYEHDLLGPDAFAGARQVEVSEHRDWEALTATRAGDDGYRRVPLSALSDALLERLAEATPNEFAVFRRGDAQETAAILKVPAPLAGSTFEPYLKMLKPGKEYAFSGIKPRNLEQKMAMEAVADFEIPFVAISGAAGTGKTMNTLAVALDKVEGGTYDRIVVIKPLVPVGGKDIGFLPGSKNEKVCAWLGPVRDNLEQLIVKRRNASLQEATDILAEMIEDGVIEVEAMTFLQGRSIANAFIIVDEAENLTKGEARMAVERCAQGSKVVFLGDLSQIQNPYLDVRSSGLAHAMKGARTSPICAAVALTKVERSPLAAAASEIFSDAGGA